MFPVQLTYELNIPIGWSLQKSLAGSIPFTDSLSIPSVSFFISLLNDSCKKGSGLIGKVPAPAHASLNVVSFHCNATHIMATCFTSNSAVSFFIQSATSSDFVPLAFRLSTATLLSVQIVVYFFTSHFLRQLVTLFSIAATFAEKQ